MIFARLLATDCGLCVAASKYLHPCTPPPLLPTLPTLPTPELAEGPTLPTSPIPLARGWVRNHQGEVVLTSYDPTGYSPQRPPKTAGVCR